jgi:hypothetical protein
MSNVPTTQFEISPLIAGNMGFFNNSTIVRNDLADPDLPTFFPTQTINPKTGNYIFTGFAYDGPIDLTQDVVFTVHGVSTAPAFIPPLAINLDSIAFGDTAAPPFLDIQPIAGPQLYGTLAPPIFPYDTGGT